MARLLTRFYDVTDGAVEVDGHDVRSLTLASLRSPTAGQLAPADVRTAEPQVETQLLGKAAARP